MMIEDWVEIGTVVAPQGLRGELRILSTSDFPERFEKAGKRRLQAPDGGEIREIHLEKGRYIPGKNIYIVALAGVDDRETAEALRGYKLLANKQDRPQLEADEYHVSDLINLEVYHHRTGEKIGVVVDIFSAGNDLLEVSLQNVAATETCEEPESITPKENPSRSTPTKVLIPFVQDIVPLVDLGGKRIEIDPPPGLLDINAP